MHASASDPVQQALVSAYAEYRDAMTAWRAAAKARRSSVSEAVTDRVLHARVALYRALVDSGWSAPPSVSTQIERDAALIAAPEDFDALLAV